MKRQWMSLVSTLIICITAVAAERDYPHRPVPFTDVKLTDSFWQPRIETNRTVTIPYAFRKSEETGRIKSFRVAGGHCRPCRSSGRFHSLPTRPPDRGLAKIRDGDGVPDRIGMGGHNLSATGSRRVRAALRHQLRP